MFLKKKIKKNFPLIASLQKIRDQKNNSQGFSFIEVLVVILMVEAFVFAAAQALVVAAVMRAEGRRISEATQWIQEDLENVKYLASIYQNAELSAAVANGNNTVTLDNATDFAAGDTFMISGDSTQYTIQSKSNNTLTLNTTSPNKPIQIAKDIGTQVSATTRCSQSTLNLGFADGLRDKILIDEGGSAATINPSTRELSKDILGKTYNMQVTLNIKDQAPYNILELHYEVSDPETDPNYDNPIAEFHSEVVPNAAFYCP